jgi:hypothetical protein
VQARFSGNDQSGKGLQQLGHVYVLAAIDTRTAEARGVGLQRAEGAVPSGKWALSLPRPGLNPNADGCTRNTSIKVVSSALRQRALAVKAVRVLSCQSVHSVFALLGPACWGQGASQSHPEGGACPNKGYTSPGNMSSSSSLILAALRGISRWCATANSNTVMMDKLSNRPSVRSLGYGGLGGQTSGVNASGNVRSGGGGINSWW